MIQKTRNSIKEFLQLESAGGILLICATILALLMKNSPLEFLYDGLLEVPVVIQVGALEIAKPLLLWINDGLMTLFFLLVGLEIKREMVEGHLADPRQIILPAIAAIGGMLVPVAIYITINNGNPESINGWAIPSATDIAFTLGVLSLLGTRIPTSIKVFLTTLAILDDVGAIVIIGLFYSHDVSGQALYFAGSAFFTLILLNRLNVMSVTAYTVVGLVLWVCVLKSGVHATLAGVTMAFAIPIKRKPRPEESHILTRREGDVSPLKRLEHDLHPWVAFMILPLFAFANAGISFEGISLQTLGTPIPMGIALGLVFGKTVGVFATSWLTIKTKLASMPEGANWTLILGSSILCGIGFTMSLFIGSLAFNYDGPDGTTYAVAVRLGVLAGSTVAAIVGYMLLRLFTKPQNEALSKG
ncbi:MAG: Na+/H+ antiporter NhaA [Magnetococcales bacterium]|nr:Na+/H+ antiporter NhaA [Magnetococcales bacterium]